MTTRIHILLAACAAAAMVVPTAVFAQQPTMLQLYNTNGAAVGARWLVRPPAAPNTGGPYTITLPSSTGTLLTGVGTTNRMTRFVSPNTLGDASFDDNYAGELSRTGNISIVANTGTFQVTSTGLNIAAIGDISDGNSAVIINDPQGLTVSQGGLGVTAGGLTVTAGGLTVTAGGVSVVAGGLSAVGTTNINNTGVVNTTTIGNAFVGNNVSVNSVVVNMANLPVGLAADALITTDGTALRETPAATIIGNTAWLINNNTFVGANATRTIGIAAQAGSEDAFAIHTDGVARLTLGGTGGITASTSLSITPVTNQIVLGTTQTTTINAVAPVASRTYTIPDAGANASFVMTEGAQTVNGAKTFTGNFVANANVSLGDAAADVVTIAGTVAGANPLVFEGATVDAFRTTINISEPLVASTVTVPNATGFMHVGGYSRLIITDPGPGTQVTYTINNIVVRANSIITVTLEDGSDVGFYNVKVGNRVANTSFDITFSASLGAGLTKVVNYSIINP